MAAMSLSTRPAALRPTRAGLVSGWKCTLARTGSDLSSQSNGLSASGDTTAHKKPHPEPILHACRIFGVRPDRNLHIGDSENDALAARAAGCPVFCVPYGYNEGRPVDSADCDALVSDLLAAYERALIFQDLNTK